MVPHTFLVPVNKITAIYHIISRVKELDVLKRLNCCSPLIPFKEGSLLRSVTPEV